MIVVLGVGNFLHGDDGAGPAVAAGVLALGLPGVSAFDCGTAPENFTGVVRSMMALSHLVQFLADAAEEIAVVGVQPLWMGDGEGLSAEVLAGVSEVVRYVREGRVLEIPELG